MQKKFKGSVAKRKFPSLTKHVRQCSHDYYIRRSTKYDSKANEQEHYSSRDSQSKVEPRYNEPLNDELLGKTNKFFYPSNSS